ncbi:hypothetical protein FA13DRAFT_821126 [Coprinellus micaceus]|uniref:Peptidase C14 caspase domain-containing protein n=1 Tax=Coprinellus micaceus TaxID=71717 RepID=A0A4Y7S3U5_COPMI|nr:hypothetical protein FA13DRAFT_821126 [Coprinellus micaceus]
MPPSESPRRSNTDSSTGSKFPPTRANKVIIWLTLQFTTIILWGTQTILFFGVVCVIVGYIGCFTVVQLSSGWKGPLLWFLCEVLLSGVRTVIWAANPEWDDARRPIVLEKVKKNDGTTTRSSSYGIGWTLDSPTADDMHALLIGVNNCNTADFENLEKAKSDAQSVAKYLEETLLVPPSQIRTLYDTDATRVKIVEELKSLRHRGSVTPDAPIIIYYAGHSFVSDDGSTYLVPHLPNGDRQLTGEPEKYCLPYSEIVDLLRHVADEKTDNIVVILDSCHAGAMGHNSHFDTQPNSAISTFSPVHPGPSHSIPSGLPSAISEQSPIEGSLGVSLLPSISRTSDTEGVPELSLTGLPPSPERQDEALAVGALTQRLNQAEDHEIRDRGKEKKRQKKITKATTEILVGHSSHLLLAGADSRQQAYEDPVRGGQFTRVLLKVLEEAGESGELQTMTYQDLVERIQDDFGAIIVDPTKTSEHQTL